jgi:O-antigen/teichoic acid export membrane protein
MKNIIDSLLTHLRTPLFRNAYALIVNEGLSAVSGLLYWLVAARLYSTELVGLNAAVISTMTFLAAMSQLSLGGALMRFLPIAGTRSAKFIWAVYGVSVVLGAIVGSVFVLGSYIWFPEGNSFLSTPLSKLGFVLSIMVWCVFVLQDGVMVGLRQATFVPIKNLVHSVSRVLFLVLLLNVLPTTAMFAAWVVPVLPLSVIMHGLIFRRLLPRHLQATAGQATRSSEVIAPKPVASFVALNHVGELLAQSAMALLPILVIRFIGAKENAYFYQTWIFSFPVQMLAWNLSNSLTVETATHYDRLSEYVGRTLRQMLRLIVPAALALALLAPFVLRLVGEDYAREGAWSLRLLALSAIPNIVTTLYISVMRVQRKMGRLLLVRVVLAALCVGLSVALLPWLGISGIGLAWLLGQGVVAAAIVLFVYPRRTHLIRLKQVAR